MYYGIYYEKSQPGEKIKFLPPPICNSVILCNSPLGHLLTLLTTLEGQK
jgi:hypothetical protein